MTEEIIFKYFPEFDIRQREMFRSLQPLYAEWNSKINVISRKDIAEINVHHILHSLAVYRFMRDNHLIAKSIIDIGTGGGFPGIPLAIAMPGTEFTLCDSIAKKIKVVTAIKNELGLENAIPITGRAESVCEKFDYAVSRGVAKLKDFIPTVRNICDKGLICLKGGDTASEIATCIREKHISPKVIFLKNISDWFEEDYFAEKRVIFIGKTK